MGSSHFLFFFLLFNLFYLLSVHRLQSPPPYTGRPARKYLGSSFSNPESEFLKVEVHKDEFNRPSAKDISSNIPEYEASIDRMGELVYHIDYHGVTTHPNPTPKHP
ncbi:uncharacterized protein LOC111779554 [Cucurbita pepo subsp. pepo]|uniref:uncharacterized protein LOC111779554 n=1 Tax=Cucurbita pepo subsp. pepo TaxID=3664 RepID=UPI000C9D92A0|nr:uncharacterized protein LOC111779554 [Cucurbita pepo subsp. pepo]